VSAVGEGGASQELARVEKKIDLKANWGVNGRQGV